MTSAIVLGGSRGIGKAISESLKSIEIDVFATSKNDIDTSNLDSVREFFLTRQNGDEGSLGEHAVANFAPSGTANEFNLTGTECRKIVV